MEVIRASSLNYFRACPYKFKNEKYEPKPILTYLGTLIHFGLTKQDYQPLLEYYLETLDGSLGTRDMVNNLVEKGLDWIEKETEGSETYKEVGMIYEYDKDNIIEGTADLVFIKDDTVNIVDYKTCSNKSWYSNEAIWGENAQHIVYSFLAMKYFKKDKAKFTYLALEKKNGVKIKGYFKEYTYKEIEKVFKEIVDDYIFSNEIDDFTPKKCRACWFCGFKKTCEEYNKEYNENRNTAYIDEFGF